MPRKRLIQTTEFPYHLTARVNNRLRFPGNLKFIWKTLTGEILIQQALAGFRVHAFVLMPNHFHLLGTAVGRSIDGVMKEIKGSATRIINTRYGRSGHLFGGRYHWSLVSDPLYYLHVYKYVLRNPVKANLCRHVADYEYSSYAGTLGFIPLPIAVLPPKWDLDHLVPDDFEARDVWLNKPHRKEENEAIRLGLRRKEFQISPDSKNRKKIILDL